MFQVAAAGVNLLETYLQQLGKCGASFECCCAAISIELMRSCDAIRALNYSTNANVKMTISISLNIGPFYCLIAPTSMDSDPLVISP